MYKSWLVALACFVTWLTIRVMLRSQHALPQDVPNDRSLHHRPIPRCGGMGVMLGAAMGWALLWPAEFAWTLLLALGLSLLSVMDDFAGLTVKTRFAAQIAAALIWVAGHGLLTASPMLAVVVILALTWMTNLYNFMDGSNGLAGGMAVIGFGFYAGAAWLGDAFPLAVISAIVAGAACGFLWFNFDPAKVFLGDAGSIPLGFLAGALGLEGWLTGVWPISFPVLVFSPFIVDASVTLAKRLWRGDKFWQAHREHYYQKLVLMGHGHKRVALFEYALMLLCGSTACLLLTHDAVMEQFWAAAVWAMLYASLMVVIDQAWFRHTQQELIR